MRKQEVIENITKELIDLNNKMYNAKFFVTHCGGQCEENERKLLKEQVEIMKEYAWKLAERILAAQEKFNKEIDKLGG